MSERGIYGVFEGSDGTGKSVQAIRITNRLEAQGFQVVRALNDETGLMEPIQEPGGTEEANRIRRWLKDKSIKRTPWENVVGFTAARKSNWNELIKPALDAGKNVITARSFISTISYQGYGEHVPIQDIIDYTLEEVGEEYMRPDFVAVLALRNEMTRKKRLENAGRERASEADTFESMPAEFQADTQNGYVRYAEEAGIEIIDTDESRDFIEGYLWAKIHSLL